MPDAPKAKAPWKRWTWRFVHPLLRWRWRLTMVVWCNFAPSSPVTYICNWTLARLWPFAWAQRRYSLAFAWMCFTPSPFFQHLTALGRIERSRGGTDA